MIQGTEDSMRMAHFQQLSKANIVNGVVVPTTSTTTSSSKNNGSCFSLSLSLSTIRRIVISPLSLQLSPPFHYCPPPSVLSAPRSSSTEGCNKLRLLVSVTLIGGQAVAAVVVEHQPSTVKCMLAELSSISHQHHHPKRAPKRAPTGASTLHHHPVSNCHRVSLSTHCECHQQSINHSTAITHKQTDEQQSLSLFPCR